MVSVMTARVHVLAMILACLAGGAIVQAGMRAATADSLEQTELAALRRYLDELSSGQPGNASRVDQLSDVSWAGLRLVIETYVALPKPIEGHTHRAFQALLERMSRTALAPWPLVRLYSAEFAEFLVTPTDKNPQGERLFRHLMTSKAGRQAFDLAVRLTPGASLDALANGDGDQRAELLEAWNRRLAQRDERRPIPQLAAHVAKICGTFAADLPPAELAARLKFAGAWPAQRERYEQQLAECLLSEEPATILAGLAAQQQFPALIELNAAFPSRFPLATTEHERLVEDALRNFAFDTEHDHAKTLRELWPKLRKEAAKARYACLYAMGMHPQGNDAVALEAVLDDSYSFIDVALAVLEAGDPKLAEQAVRHVLTNSKRGHEEALRLARSMKLAGFADAALAIATSGERDQVLRQTALAYLQLAPGKTRRKLLPLLAHTNGDLRLSAIQTFAAPEGLKPEDKDEIGPALIRVAQSDASFGHRQEAIFALGRWRDELAAPFFRELLKTYPPVVLAAGHYNDGNTSDDRYWQYRLRLVALTGLAALRDKAAREELLALYKNGGPTEKMDVLLAFFELEDVPLPAFDDLSADEPKLVATAASLVKQHGTPDERKQMHEFFASSPFWRQFEHSGIDDHNILRNAGLIEELDATR